MFMPTCMVNLCMNILILIFVVFSINHVSINTVMSIVIKLHFLDYIFGSITHHRVGRLYK